MYRDIQSATVEKNGQILEISYDTPVGKQSQPLFPESPAPDEFSFFLHLLELVHEFPWNSI